MEKTLEFIFKSFEATDPRSELCVATVEMYVFGNKDIHFIKDNNLSYAEITNYRDFIFRLEEEYHSYKQIRVRKEEYKKKLLEKRVS